MKVNTSGTLTFNGTAVSLAGHPHSEYVAVTGDTMTDDLTFEKTGETNVGSHGIIFQGHNALFDPADYSKKLDMAISGDLRFDGNILATQSYVTSRGYITGYTVTSSDVTTALGYTPVNKVGDTMTGNLTISKTDPALILSDTNATSGSYPRIQFDTTNAQGIELYHNEFDSELPVGGYGLVVGPSDNNTQFPTTGTLSLAVLGEIYAGSTSLSTTKKVYHEGNLDFDLNGTTLTITY